MPAVVRSDQQSVCSSSRFRDHGNPHVSRCGGDLPWGAGEVLERSDENAGGARNAAGAGPGSSGGDPSGQSRETHFAYAGFPESHGNFNATGIAAEVVGVGWTPPGSSGGRSHLRAVACARGTHSFAEAARPLASG